VHRNAPLTPAGRLRMVRLVEAGVPQAHVAERMQVSRPTVKKWWDRYLVAGEDGLVDQSSRPHRSPTRTPARLEQRIVGLRQSRKLGPARIAGIVGLPASTVHRVLVREGLNRLAWMDRPTGRVIRRIEMSRPGELVHIDIKKLGRVPAGGGWRAYGRAQRPARHRSIGYAYIHTAVDGYSRVAYSEIHSDEQAVTAIGFWHRARYWFAQRGITIERVLTDNGSCYRAHAFNAALTAAGVRHSCTRPYRPQTNGKVERFNRTLLDEWAYVRIYRSDNARNRALDRWLHNYNHHRTHTALGGNPPMSRVNNLPGQYS
jgi:transposase InsO family protein